MPNPNNPIFPANVPTDDDLLVASRRAIGKLIQPMTQVDTVAVLDSGEGTRFQVPCLVQIGQEIVRVKAKAGDILQQIDRAFVGTVAAPHAEESSVRGYILDWHHNQMAAEIKALATTLGANLSNVVRHVDTTDAGDVEGVFTNLALKAVGSAGTYGGPGNWVQITTDTKGRVVGTTVSKGFNYYPIFYKAAIIHGTNAVLGFSFGEDDAPNAVPVVGANGVLYAVAQFTQLNEYWVQDHFSLPEDLDTDTPANLDIIWRTGETTGNVTWRVRTAGMRNGSTSDPELSGATTTTIAAPAVANQVAVSRINNFPLTGLQGGDELFFRFARAADDTVAGVVELIGLRWNIPRRHSVV